MHGAKVVAAGLVEDGDQIDDGIAAADGLCQSLGIVDIGIDHFYRWQHQQLAMPFPMTGRDAHPMTGRGQKRHQVATDEAGAPQDANRMFLRAQQDLSSISLRRGWIVAAVVA